MAEDTREGDEGHGEEDAGAGEGGGSRWERDTAPQQPYSMRQVWIGLAVLAIGLVVTVAIPLALA